MTLRAVAAMLCASLLAGCYQIRYTRRVAAEPLPRSDRWHHNLIAGLWEFSEPVKTHAICPYGIARVEQAQSFTNVLAQAGVQLAFGGAIGGGTRRADAGGGVAALQLWTPSTVKVWCAVEDASKPEPAPAPVVAPLAAPLRMAVLPLVARTGISDEEAMLFTDSLANALRAVPNVGVVTRDDLIAVLDVEEQKQLLGCESDSACLTELGGALGVDRVVHGSVGRIGASFVVNLALVDPSVGRAVGSVNERRTSESNDVFFDLLPELVAGLLANEPRS